MSRMTIGLLSEEAALSAAEANGNPAVVDEIAQGDAVVSDELATAATEADELQGAIDEGAASVEELSEGVDAIETEIADNGGLDQPAMESYMRQLKSIARRNTLPIGRRQVSLESHASKVTRLRASKLALEDWKESLSKAWEAIKAAFARAKEIVVNFFKALFDRAERVKQKAVKLKAAATAAKGSADDKAKVKLGSLFSNLAKHMQVNGKMISGDEVLSQFKATSKLTDEMAATIIEKGAAIVNEIVDDFGNFVSKGEKPDVGNLVSPLQKLAVFAPKPVKGDAPEGFVKKTSLGLMGDKVFTFILPKEGATAEQVRAGIGRISIGIEDLEGRQEAVEKETDPMSVATVIALADEVIRSMDNLAKMSKVQPSTVGKVFDSVLAKIKSFKDEKAAENASLASAIAAMSTRLIGPAISAVRTYTVNVSDAALSYAAASLKTLKGGEAAAA